MTVNDNDLIINPSTKHYLTSTDSIRFLEFYVVKDTVAYFDILLPVKNQNDVVGFIVIKIDPYDFIFPTINMWPRKSNTAQTILYKRNLDTVYSVNPFKSIAHKPLNNVYTMADTNVPIIKVINGEKGQYYGPDYKGDIVYAFVTDFQPYDWYLVVKINESEVLESFYDHVLMVLASGFVILILLIITLFLRYRSHQKDIYKELYDKEYNLRLNNEKFKTTLYSIGDGVISTDDKGIVTQMNFAAEQLTGWSEQEAAGKRIEEVFNLINGENNQVVPNPVSNVIKTGNVSALTNHTLLLDKKLKSVHIAHNASPIKDNNGNLIGVILVIRDQTNEYQKMQILEESEKKTKNLLEKLNSTQRISKSGSWEVNITNNQVWWSEEMFNIFEEDDLTFQPDRDVILRYLSQEERDKYAKIATESIQSKKEFDIELCITTKKGNKKFVQIIGVPEYTDGIIERVILSVIDISDLRKVQLELENNLTNYQNLIKVSPDAILVHRDNKIMLVNNALCKLIGVNSEDELIGKSPLDITHSDCHEVINERISQLKENIIPPLVQIKLLKSNGETTMVESSTSRFNTSDGIAYQVIMRDISERLFFIEKLRKNEERLNLAINSSKTGVWEWDLPTGYFFWSDECYHILGIDDAIDLSYELFEGLIHPEDTNFYKEQIKDILSNSLKNFNFKFRLVKPDNKVIWLQNQGIVSYNNGNPVKIIGTLNDITLKENTERENQLSIAVLSTLNHKLELKDLIKNLTLIIKDWVACDAVGVRLQLGGDYPYFETTGFTSDFVEKERNLCTKNSLGHLVLNNNNEPILNCMCGYVLKGDIDETSRYFTASKSFWTNNLEELINYEPSEFTQIFTRGHCNKEGYKSLALIPVKSENIVHGLIQLNHFNPNKFTYDLIKFMERIANLIASTLAYRKVESELVESEKKYRTLFENMPEAILLCELVQKPGKDNDFLVLSSNNKLEEFIGVNSFSGKKMSGLMPWFNRDNYGDVLSTFDDIAGNGGFTKLEKYFAELDTWLSLSVYSPKENQFVVLMENITDRKKKESEIRKLSRAVDQSPVTIVITDTDGNIEYANPSFTKTTGYELDEVIKHNPRVLKSGETTQQEYERLWQTISTGKTWQGEFKNIKKNKETYWELATIAPIMDENNIITNYVAIKEDITERKQITEQIKNSEAKFRSYIEKAPIGIFISDSL